MVTNYIEKDTGIVIKTQDIIDWLISICVHRGYGNRIQRGIIKGRIFENKVITENNLLLIISYALGYYLYYGPVRKRSFNWSYSDVEKMCIILSNIKKNVSEIIVPLNLNINDFINLNLLRSLT